MPDPTEDVEIEEGAKNPDAETPEPEADANADEVVPDADAEDAAPDAQEDAGDAEEGDEDPGKAIPYARFKKAVDERNELRAVVEAHENKLTELIAAHESQMAEAGGAAVTMERVQRDLTLAQKYGIVDPDTADYLTYKYEAGANGGDEAKLPFTDWFEAFRATDPKVLWTVATKNKGEPKPAKKSPDINEGASDIPAEEADMDISKMTKEQLRAHRGELRKRHGKMNFGEPRY